MTHFHLVTYGQISGSEFTTRSSGPVLTVRACRRLLSDFVDACEDDGMKMAECLVAGSVARARMESGDRTINAQMTSCTNEFCTQDKN